jgi:hypothetical protein
LGGIKPEDQSVEHEPGNPTPQFTMQRSSMTGADRSPNIYEANYRQRLTVGRLKARGSIGGREYLNFCSNDYLGLAAHLNIESFRNLKYGVGSGASTLSVVIALHITSWKKHPLQISADQERCYFPVAIWLTWNHDSIAER